MAIRNGDVIAQAMVRLLMQNACTVPPKVRRANAILWGVQLTSRAVLRRTMAPALCEKPALQRRTDLKFVDGLFLVAVSSSGVSTRPSKAAGAPLATSHAATSFLTAPK
jgi:hypothetical protein